MINIKLKKYFLNNKDKREKLILKLRTIYEVPEISEHIGYPNGVIIYYVVKGLLQMEYMDQIDYIQNKVKLNKEEFKKYMKCKIKKKKKQYARSRISI